MKRNSPPKKTTHGHKQPRSQATLRRARRPSLTDDEFLNVALELFAEHGFERTSIEIICATAGMAKRTAYLRYRDKKTLFIAALRGAIDRWIVPVERLQAAEHDTLEDSLLAIGQILVHNLLSPQGMRLLRLTNAESGRMPEIGEFTVHFGSDRTIAYLADLFRRKLDQLGHGLPEAEDAAETFLHLIVGGPANAAAWGVVRDKAAIERRIRFSVRVFVHGLLTTVRDDPTGGAVVALENIYQRLAELLQQTTDQLALTHTQLARLREQ